MHPARFIQLTRRTGFEQVIEGILAAKDAGFDPVKVNAVAIKGVTEDDVIPLALYSAAGHGLDLRFIEYMPLDAGDAWELAAKVLFADEILEILRREIGPLRLCLDPDADPRAPAARLCFRGWRRTGRHDCLREPPVLRELQPRPPDGRRQTQELLVRAGRDGHSRVDAIWRVGCRTCECPANEHCGQMGRSSD